MIENDLYIILSEKYDIKKNKDNINIFSVKKNHLDNKLKLNYSDYKIIIKFTKKSLIILKIGISMNLKKIKCIIGTNKYKINTVFSIKLKVESNDIIELEIKILKKYFEIFIKIDEINNLIDISEIYNMNNDNELDLIKNNDMKLIDTQSSNISDVSDFSETGNNNNLDAIVDLKDEKKNFTMTKGEILSLLKAESKQKINKIIVVLSKFIESIGKFFKLIFESRGFECEIIYFLSLLDCIESTHNQMYLIVYSDQTHLAIPNRFIYYQVEQVKSVFLKNPKLLKKTLYMMTKAEQVWEYTSLTRPIYSKYCENKLKWVPMPYFYIENISIIEFNSCKYDVFFYGHPNERRKNILNELRKDFNIKIGYGYYENKKISHLINSKIILNLHFYKNAGLETCRINEILNYNKLIVSESSPLDAYNMQLYSDYVIFVDEIDDNLSNIKKLIKIIKFYLDWSNYKNKINFDKEKISNNISKLISL
jgi:hypothetical protein